MIFKKPNCSSNLMLFVIVFCTFLSLKAQVIIEDDKMESVSLRPYAEILEAGQEHYTTDSIFNPDLKLPFIPLDSLQESIGFSNEPYWVRFSIENKTDTPLSYYLETGRPITDRVTLYLKDATENISIYESGDAIPFSEKSIAHRKSVFHLDLDERSKWEVAIYLKSDGEVLNLPLNLINERDFLYASSRDQLFYGLFYGILVLAGILYLFFYSAMRDVTFLYYCFYVLFIALLEFSLDGLFHQYVLPDAGYISKRGVLANAIISIFFFSKYVQKFLNIDECNKLLLLTFKISAIVLPVCILGLFCFPDFLASFYPIINVYGLLLMVQVNVAIIYLKLKKKEVDNFFVTGIACLTIGFTVFILNNLNFLTTNFFTENGVKFGIGLEVIFLSLSMGNRIRNLRKATDEMNILALNYAENMNDVKSSFISNISHELRTPLNAIMGVATSLREDESYEDLKEKCQLILSSSENLLGSIEDILDFTVIEKGNQELEHEPFNLHCVLRKLKRIHEERALSKGLNFHFSAQQGLPKMIVGDKLKLMQILDNLLDNAVKFTPDGEVTLNVGYKKTSVTSMAVNFSITDTGIGIAKEKMDSIFEAFTKKSFLDKREFYGLGLGLYIVKSYVDLKDGKVSLTNNEKYGITCTVDLQFELDREEMYIGENRFNDDITKFGYETNILLVEDNAINQKVISLLLKKHENIHLKIAENGQEALELIRIHSFDLVLMDLQMPIMDGFEATSAIRSGQAGQNAANLPIIVLTADSTDKTKKEVLRLGANAYLTKPIKGEVLFRVLSENLVRV